MATAYKARFVHTLSPQKLSAAVLSICVATAAIFMIGSTHPFSKGDKRIVLDLYHAQGVVDTYYQKEGKLPSMIAVGGIRYQPKDGSAYQLCASFTYSQPQIESYHPGTYFSGYKKGNYCFELDAYADSVTAGKYNNNYDSRYEGPI